MARPTGYYPGRYGLVVSVVYVGAYVAGLQHPAGQGRNVLRRPAVRRPILFWSAISSAGQLYRRRHIYPFRGTRADCYPTYAGQLPRISRVLATLTLTAPSGYDIVVTAGGHRFIANVFRHRAPVRHVYPSG